MCVYEIKKRERKETLRGRRRVRKKGKRGSRKEEGERECVREKGW